MTNRDRPTDARTPKSALRALWHPSVLRAAVDFVRDGRLTVGSPPDTIDLRDSTVLDLPGDPHVVATPGHTPGSTSIWLPQQRAICTGDAVCTLEPLRGTTGLSTRLPSVDADPIQAATSFAKIMAMRATLILPGHGEPHFVH